MNSLRGRHRNFVSRRGDGVSARKRWIGYTLPPKGRLVLDAGARRAVEELGRSLLAIGVVRVEGDFAKGEVVSLVDQSGAEFARGLTNYDNLAARAIAGKGRTKSPERLPCLTQRSFIAIIWW